MSAAKPSKQALAQQRPWSVPVAIDDVPETGRRIELAPAPTTRAALAKLARVAGLPRLFAGFDLTRHGRDGLRVVGSVQATVEQACVVTLEAIRGPDFPMLQGTFLVFSVGVIFANLLADVLYFYLDPRVQSR